MATHGAGSRRILQRTQSAKYVLLVTGSMLAMTYVACAYDGAAHRNIAGQAIDNYLAWVNQDNDGRVGEIVNAYRTQILDGSEEEDGGLRQLNHFWDPTNGAGFPGGQPALGYAQGLYGNALSSYEEEHYNEGFGTGAYHYLGRVVHLIGDMGVPAHVLIDEHIGGDTYEGRNAANYRTESQIQTGTLEQLMRAVAEIANDYDSDDEDGQTGIVNRIPDLDNAECNTIADACFPAAVRSAGGILMNFFSDIQPGAIIQFPAHGDICSGQAPGIELTIVADSYDNERHLDEITLDFCEDITLNVWSRIGTITGNTGNMYTYDWPNHINDDEVWIRVQCRDTGDCESVIYMHWVSIDSTSPNITNATY